MAMNLGNWASRSVATLVVATDGTGDFTDIQTAIDALPATGGCVYIKEGTYALTATITIPNDNISLLGCGASTIITHSGTPNIGLIYATNKDRILITNIRFIGWGSPIAFALVRLDATVESIIDGCWFFSGDTAAIFITGSSNCIVTNNHISGNVGRGIMMSGSGTGGIISSNTVGLCDKDGIYIADTSRIIIVSNYVYDNDFGDTATYDGIRFNDDVDYSLIGNNICKDNDRYDINIVNNTSDRNIIVSNNCYGTDHVGAINNVGTNTQIAHNITA